MQLPIEESVCLRFKSSLRCENFTNPFNGFRIKRSKVKGPTPSEDKIREIIRPETKTLTYSGEEFLLSTEWKSKAKLSIVATVACWLLAHLLLLVELNAQHTLIRQSSQ